jgi:glycerol kinase
MKERYVAAIDQGTGSSRCLIFDHSGRIVSVAQKEHFSVFPRPGWVEHDPEEIWNNVQAVVDRALTSADIKPSDLAALGIANQRETTVVWDRETGKPVHPAISWEDTRTKRLIQKLAAEPRGKELLARTGLPPSSYFAGPKIRWILDHTPGLQERAEAGELLFGTMDSWLIWRLTGRHLTDVTNASRTMMMDLDTLDWDDELVDWIGIPHRMLPEIRPSAEYYADARGELEGVPVAAAVGDQQAALFGQTCFGGGDTKCTYGTGAFMLMNTGEQLVRSGNGLATTVCCQVGDEAPTYALEGSIAVTGSLVRWVRDNLELIGSAPEIETLARTVDDNGGCYFVPAFSGLYAPYWRPDARGAIMGLTSYITKGHIARAVLEATAWQTRDVVEAMSSDSGIVLGDLRVDGGMTANNLLMQLVSDVLGVPVVRPIVAETVSLGAAYAAGLAVGFWQDRGELRDNWHIAAQWVPQMDADQRERGYRKWTKAVERVSGWLDPDEDDAG